MRVVLENDDHLSDAFAGYLDENPAEREIIFEAGREYTGRIIDAFAKCDVLEIQPTMLTFSQYNLMVMAMYQLITEDRLSIKEIHIFYNRSIEDDLRELWGDKRKYLDQVLERVKVFSVARHSEPVELHI